MTRHVEWSRAALDDLREQIAYIAADNPATACRVADRIRDAAAAFSEKATGRPGRVAGTYEKSVARLRYIIAHATPRGGQHPVKCLIPPPRPCSALPRT